MTPEKVLYIAVVLTKQAQYKLFDLIKTVVEIPKDWKKIGHHMTVTFNGVKPAVEPGYFDEDVSFGMKCTIIPVGYKMDEKGLAVQVVSSPQGSRLRVDNAHPHITVAVAPGTSPVYSNKLLESGNIVPFSTQPFLDGYLLKVLPGGKVSPAMGDLADDVFVGN
jgi:hypothetical protein